MEVLKIQKPEVPAKGEIKKALWGIVSEGVQALQNPKYTNYKAKNENNEQEGKHNKNRTV